ncbi:MAG: hypothetical protein M1814_005604 [Vezdaea aestivalis]|nr:MAG: hypothetical protein M1814_005604 [Vezdaea aestivalis]
MLLLFWSIERRQRSGLFSDPSSIASLSTLFHHPEVVRDFQNLDPDASKADMEVLLEKKRYRLGYYTHMDGSERHGIVPAVKEPKSPQQLRRKRTLRVTNTFQALNTSGLRIPGTAIGHRVSKAEDRPISVKKREIYHAGRDCFLGGITVATLIIIVWHYLNSNQNAFERWLNNGKHFGPRVFFSILGVLIYSQWKRLERDICILQPFRALNLGAPLAERSILIERTLSPFTTLFVSIRRKRVYCTLAALDGVLAEILIITLSGIPFNDGQLFTAFCVSVYLSISILSFMLLTLLAVFLRPGELKLPHTPNTIGSVLSYLCASITLKDFAGLSTLNNKMKSRRIKDMGRRYTFDVLRDGDGVMRWTIDYDRDDREA